MDNPTENLTPQEKRDLGQLNGIQATQTRRNPLAKDDPSRPRTAADMVALIRKKYPRPQYVVLEQVCDATGFKGNRFADVIVVSCWPSNGLWIAGIEIKVSRSDWQHELKQPEKSAAFQRYCDYWYLACPDRAMLKPGELPASWGLMSCDRHRQLRVDPTAPKLTPIPLDAGFVASVMRNAMEVVQSRTEIEAEIERARATAFSDGKRVGKQDAMSQLSAGTLQRELTELKEAVARFEEASGLKISRWNAGNIGTAVKAVMSGDVEHHLLALQRIQNTTAELKRAVDEQAGLLTAAMAEINAARTASAAPNTGSNTSTQA